MSSKDFFATVRSWLSIGRDKQLGVRFMRWVQANTPTRESLEGNRWLRPVAHRVLAPELWRLTRRSVPRGVALGMLTGILIPAGQIVASAIFALPIRANIPAAALTTFLTNPVTTPPLWILAYKVGRWVLGYDVTVVGDTAAEQLAESPGWLQWLLAEAGPATATGLVVLAIVGAILGYFLSALGWRIWIARKWEKRRLGRAD